MNHNRLELVFNVDFHRSQTLLMRRYKSIDINLTYHLTIILKLIVQ